MFFTFDIQGTDLWIPGPTFNGSFTLDTLGLHSIAFKWDEFRKYEEYSWLAYTKTFHFFHLVLTLAQNWVWISILYHFRLLANHI